MEAEPERAATVAGVTVTVDAAAAPSERVTGAARAPALEPRRDTTWARRAAGAPTKEKQAIRVGVLGGAWVMASK